jgi:hypothetical protein
MQVMEAKPLRERLVELMRPWEAFEIDETYVRDTAEALDLAWAGWRVLDSVSADGEPADVRATADNPHHTSDLDTRYVTRADIPAMVACLETIETDPIAAQTSWITYGNGIDWKTRAQELRSHPFYAGGRGTTG